LRARARAEPRSRRAAVRAAKREQKERRKLAVKTAAKLRMSVARVMAAESLNDLSYDLAPISALAAEAMGTLLGALCARLPRAARRHRAPRHSPAALARPVRRSQRRRGG